jgi:phage-related protein
MSPEEASREIGRHWRFYETTAGSRPVREFLDRIGDDDRDAVVAGMARVREYGLSRARHVRGDIWEVRTVGRAEAFRVLFSPEGKKGRVLLAIEGFSKKSEKTPPQLIDLAERRLRDWRARGGS